MMSSSGHRQGIKEAPTSSSLRSKRINESGSVRKKSRESALASKRIKNTFEHDSSIVSTLQELKESIKNIQKLSPSNTDEIKKLLLKLSHFFTLEFALSQKKEEEEENAMTGTEEESKDEGDKMDPETLSSLVLVLQKSLENLDADVKFHAVWCITNMAATKYVESLGELIPQLLHCLDLENDKLREQVTWALGNIASDHIELRDKIVRAGAFAPIIKILSLPVCPDEVIQCCCFCLTNLLRGPNPAVFDLLKQDVISSLSTHMKNEAPLVISEICWVVVYLTSMIDRYQDYLLKDMIVPKYLVHSLNFLSSRSNDNDCPPALCIPIVRALGNVICANKSFALSFISENPDAVPSLLKLIAGHSRPLKKEALWVLSNLTVDYDANSVEAFISSNPRLVEILFSVLNNDTFDLKKEAAYSVMNIYALGNEKVSTSIDTSYNAPEIFSRFVRAEDNEIVELGLYFFKEYLKQKRVTAFSKIQELDSLVSTLEALCYKDSPEIRTCSSLILETLEQIDEEINNGNTEMQRD